MRLALVLAAAVVLLPGVATAQAYSCRVPSAMPRPRPDLPSQSQPRRILPIGSYTLAITWSPGYCRANADRPSSRFQCADGNRFGFTLHGLWPDGVGKDWPQYCRATDLLPRRTIAANLCATPSAQLLQHEWAKHGTCMAGYTPARYFGRATALYGRLRYPDMDALSRRPLTAGGFAQAMARANPGLSPDMMRVTADRQGWLDEVWICLDKTFRYRRCPAHQGGLAPGASLRIWRGRR
ncbi:ribonuclease T2 family protein [Sphingomonas rubra]|uniref:Ribonuclease T2 n=1 Tax=Sphingomonas rubra TaxID=634430 RepID=A0A1I5U1B9_9SPHN|nr:ribonuclease T2 [Sphingomonas rubra]SFP89073.1 ribonuclease T2 [Sphingomonas rubra]